MLVKDTKKLKEDVSVGNKKIAASSITGKVSAGVVLASLLSLTACGGGGGSGASVPGTGSTGGGTTATACTDIPGEPDILGQISFSSATGTAGDTVMLNLPVDAETQYVLVWLRNATLPPGGGFIGGQTNPLVYAVPSPGVQTLSLPIEITSTVKTNYSADITLCTVDPAQCQSPNAGTTLGVATVYSDILGLGVFTRFGLTGPVQSQSCVNSPVFTVQ